MRAQLAALQAQHSSLVIKHGFLVGICEFLAHMRTKWTCDQEAQDEDTDKQPQEAAASAAAGSYADTDLARSDSEQQLLQLLRELPSIAAAQEQHEHAAATPASDHRCAGSSSSMAWKATSSTGATAAAAADATDCTAGLHAADSGAAAAGSSAAAFWGGAV